MGFTNFSDKQIALCYHCSKLNSSTIIGEGGCGWKPHLPAWIELIPQLSWVRDAYSTHRKVTA